MSDLKKFIDLLNSGDIVAFPTETVYGLGANAWNPSAIQKVFKTKGRPSDNPLIVHISNIDQLQEFVSEVPESADTLIEKFWPGPLTLVFKKEPKVLDLITAGLDTVAIRMPDHKLALELIKETGPLVAPSANKSGRPSPTKPEHVKADFGEDLPVIDGGSTEVGIESTVLDLTSETPVILRPGKIGKKEIEDVLGKKVALSNHKNTSTPKSPGQKYSHYKPTASVRYEKIESIEASTLYLTQSELAISGKNVVQYSGNLEQLSRELYDRFREADLEGFETIIIEKLDAYQESNPSMYTALINRIQKAVD
jgi:L-threonylcarbamoyladenylate synthase